jgi:zinc/manganese transport system substrate-binding protein
VRSLYSSKFFRQIGDLKMFSNTQKLARYLFLCLGLLTLPVHATLKVLACEPEWAALVTELAGDKASVQSATTAAQDPHQIQARPSLVAASRSAQLLVCTGAELETGWLPLLLRQSANPAIQPGQAGYFEAASFITLLEIPTKLDRADGDVHAAGNPHIQTDPRHITPIAKALAERLAQLDPSNAVFYKQRHVDFANRWAEALKRWEKAAAPLKGMGIVVQHKAFPYLENWLNLPQRAALEPKPGVEPNSSHLSAVLAQLKQTPARAILRFNYSDDRGAQWLSERAQIPVLVLPSTVGATDQAKDLFGLYDELVAQLLKALK